MSIRDFDKANLRCIFQWKIFFQSMERYPRRLILILRIMKSLNIFGLNFRLNFLVKIDTDFFTHLRKRLVTNQSVFLHRNWNLIALRFRSKAFAHFSVGIFRLRDFFIFISFLMNIQFIHLLNAKSRIPKSIWPSENFISYDVKSCKKPVENRSIVNN